MFISKLEIELRQHALYPKIILGKINYGLLAGQTESHVENSEHFVKTDVCMAEDEVLVSFDIVSLFTNVPIGEPVKIIQQRLRDNEDLVMGPCHQTGLGSFWSCA